MENNNPLKELVRVLLRNLGALEKHGASCRGATVGQCHAIQEIGIANEISLNKLAEALNLEKSTVSRSVDNLVNQSFVERIIDPIDRRYVNIKLTQKGQQIFEEINFSFEFYYKNILESLPENKQQQVIESLWILITAVKDFKCC